MRSSSLGWTLAIATESYKSMRRVRSPPSCSAWEGRGDVTVLVETVYSLRRRMKVYCSQER